MSSIGTTATEKASPIILSRRSNHSVESLVGGANVSMNVLMSAAMSSLAAAMPAYS